MDPVASSFVTPPRTLGRYELLGALAKGGMATVYLARHTGSGGFQRLYAVKVLHPHLTDEEFLHMLLDEARIAARLHHPNVVPIVDLGSQDGLHYVAMEYVEGCALSAVLTKFRDSRPPKTIVPIILDTLAGLHAAHTLVDDSGTPLQLVHRDVSPQNVLVGVDGTARLIDFGIAKAQATIHSTRPGQLKGKLAFMAPEQIVNPSGSDARVDIFAVGVMMWSALTGRRLFLGDNDAQTVHNILKLEIPAPSTVGHRPPAVLDRIIMRALARDPSKRYQTALEMEEDLREVAVKSDLFGSKRDVANWVQAAFGEQLEERRHTIAAVTTGNNSGNFTLSAQSSISGLRATAPLGLEGRAPTPISTPRLEETSSSSGDVRPPLDPAVENQVTLETETLKPKSKATTYAVLAFAALLLVGGGIFVATRKNAAADDAGKPVAASPERATAATMLSAAVAHPPTTSAPIATQAPAPTHEPSARANDAPIASASARPRPQATWRPAAAPAPAPKPIAPAQPPATSEPKKKPQQAWDNDSPLPPP